MRNYFTNPPKRASKKYTDWLQTLYTFSLFYGLVITHSSEVIRYTKKNNAVRVLILNKNAFYDRGKIYKVFQFTPEVARVIGENTTYSGSIEALMQFKHNGIDVNL